MEPRRLLTIKQACELAGVSRRTIYHWLKARKLECVRTAGGSPRIYEDSLLRVHPQSKPEDEDMTDMLSTHRPTTTRRVLTVVAFLLLCAAPAAAQTVVNPTTYAFDHGDFAVTSDYEFGYFTSATATTPVQSGIAPKPATCSPCTGPLPSRPNTFQNWWVAVRARAGAAVSPWSNYVPFDRQLLAPANLTAK